MKSKSKKKKIIKKVLPRKKKAKIIKKKKILVKKILVNNFSAQSLFRARIKVVGIGGGGGSIVSEIGRSLQKANFVVADTDIRSLKKKSGIKYFLFGQNKVHGLGTGTNIELAKEAAIESEEKIKELFADQDIVILIASLGGGIGSGASEIFAKAAMNSGAITLGIFTLPFKFEGKNKFKIANDSLKQLKQALNVSITIPNERIFKVIDNNTSITQAFSVINKNLIESLESLIDLIYNPGLINIDFADLRSILRGNGSCAFLNTVCESGKDRAEKTIEHIMNNPLYQVNNFTPEKILFNISGHSDLSMFEVEKISQSIAKVNPNAKIIFGISRDGKLKNKIKTTILTTGQDNSRKIVEKKVSEKVAIQEKPLQEKVVPKIKLKKVNKIELLKENLIPSPIMAEQELADSIERKFAIIDKDKKEKKKAIRRSGIEVKKTEEMQESKRLAQEEEWEIPAFLRRVKFKS